MVIGFILGIIVGAFIQLIPDIIKFIRNKMREYSYEDSY